MNQPDQCCNLDLTWAMRVKRTPNATRVRTILIEVSREETGWSRRESYSMHHVFEQVPRDQWDLVVIVLSLADAHDQAGSGQGTTGKAADVPDL